MEKKTKSDQQTAARVVPFSAINPHTFPNCRQGLDLTKVERLKASIKAQGLLTPLTVTNGGDEYALISGFNRYAALKDLGAKEVRVEVREFSKDDLAAPFVDNLAENIARDDVHPADTSKRIGEIVSGEILRKGEEDPLEDPKVDRKDLAKKIGLSQSHFGNLLRADKNCIPEVKAAWRKHDIATSLVFEWSTFTAEEQATALAEWLEAREKLLNSGRKRAKKKAKKESEEERSERLSVNELRVALGRCIDKRDAGKLKGADKAFLEGKIRGLELALGDITEATFLRGH